jgi:hypothetical protein
MHERISNLRQSIAAMSKLCGEEFDEEDPLGLTDAIRQLFKTTMDRSMTAQDVTLALESRGFNVSRYGNILASIHTVLKRLTAKGEIESAGNIEGKPAYRLNIIRAAFSTLAELSQEAAAIDVKKKK